MPHIPKGQRLPVNTSFLATGAQFDPAPIARGAADSVRQQRPFDIAARRLCSHPCSGPCR